MAPLGLLLIYLGYQSFMTPNYPYSIYAGIPLVGLMVLYLFRPQIDYWWLSKYPVKFDEKLGEFLRERNPFYASLTGEEKTKFENRLSLYMEGRDFKAVGREQRDIPYDFKAMISAIPIELTMNKEDFLLGDMDRIFVYKHPFPTPGKPYLHTMETHVTDGVIILSLEHFSAAEKNPEEHYNVAWHAYIEAYLLIFKDDTSKIDHYASWDNIQAIGGFDEAGLLKYTGEKALDPLIVLLTLFKTRPTSFKENLPAAYADIKSFFEQSDKKLKVTV